MSTEKQNVVIVGAGFTGLNTWNALAAKLDATKHELVLITPRSFFAYYPATIRMVVTTEGKLEDTILMPLPDDKYNTGNKKLILGSVASIVEQENQGGYVVLENGEKVDYSLLILTPGTVWDGPFALPVERADVLDSVNNWRARFAKAENIVLVGGGAIGLELAGEIKDFASDKTVTIVHGGSRLLNDTYSDCWRDYIAKQYKSRGVELVLGDYVDNLDIKDGHVVTRAGKQIPADLVVPTRGGRPNTKFIESLGDVLTASGTVKVTPTLQVVGHPRILVGGDVVDWKEQKQAAKAPNHASVLAGNALSLLGVTKKALTPYKGSTEIIIVTNGKNGGTGFFNVLWGISIGNWLSVMLKSKGLMIDMMKKSLGFA